MTHHFNSKKLLHLRQEKFWTQEDLALASGVSVRTLQRMENSKSASIESWKSVTAAFDVSPETFRTIDNSERALDDYRRPKFNGAVIGISLSCIGALLGCFFGWYRIFSSTPDFQSAFAQLPFYTSCVMIVTLAYFLIPIVIWQRTLR